MLTQPFTLEALARDRMAENLREVERDRLASQARRWWGRRPAAAPPLAVVTPLDRHRGLPFWDTRTTEREAS